VLTKSPFFPTFHPYSADECHEKREAAKSSKELLKIWLGMAEDSFGN